MDAETRGKIKQTVRGILEEANMDEMTEYKIRQMASQILELNLSESKYKAYVRHVVNSFLEEQKAKQEEAEAAANDDNTNKNNKEFDDDGDVIVCRLSERRRVMIQDFRGKSLVSIREFYKKDGKELPSAKGISLTEEQWSALKKNIPNIEKAVRKMESHTM
ncbi:RNA polymerase II transcriptional coactivator KELP [Herrania umbratica]|uniref:RNA polymerase II transcriptional coactivator KELP n=1 Tax=Herrania umbratica TaxID=108875 RepID=A0A6J1BFT2_9ROSI|nr:RNA polymerase II transcriptional coactivator KELP [Herrania umbratica]